MRMKSKAFVDTTVLTDALLKVGEQHDKAKAALSKYKSTLLPVYAIKEFKGGPLRRYIWLHNKLVTLNSFNATLAALQRVSATPQRYLTSTALQALQTVAHSIRKLPLAAFSKKYGDAATLDDVLRDEFRLTLRLKVLKAWSQRRKLTSTVVDELSCYLESAPVLKNGLIEIKPTKCAVEETECCRAAEFKGRRSDLEVLHSVLESRTTPTERDRRKRVLRELIRKPRQAMTDAMCSDLGDAVFVLCCPNDADILTTNVKDHEPLAAALGKTVVCP
jgi:hypothetical protein